MFVVGFSSFGGPGKGTAARTLHERYNAIFHDLRSDRCGEWASRQCDRTVAVGEEGEIVVEKLHVRDMPDMTGKSMGIWRFGKSFSVKEVATDCVMLDGRRGRWIRVHAAWEADEVAEGWVFDAYVDYRPLQEWQKRQQ